MATLWLRLFLVLATLHLQVPCACFWGAGAAPTVTAPEGSVPHGKSCPCCKRAQSRSESAPRPAPQTPSPAKPCCPSDCPCSLCSPGFVPLSPAASPAVV